MAKQVKCIKGESVGFELSNLQKFKMSHGSDWSSFSSNHHMKQHSPANHYWPQSFGKCENSGKRNEAHSNQNQASSLKFSGMNLGDVMKVTVMEEMKNCLYILRKSARKIRKMLEISGISEKFSFFISFFHSSP